MTRPQGSSREGLQRGLPMGFTKLTTTYSHTNVSWIRDGEGNRHTFPVGKNGSRAGLAIEGGLFLCCKRGIRFDQRRSQNKERGPWCLSFLAAIPAGGGHFRVLHLKLCELGRLPQAPPNPKFVGTVGVLERNVACRCGPPAGKAIPLPSPSKTYTLTHNIPHRLSRIQ